MTFPKRGLAAMLVTTAALVLLLNVSTPSATPAATAVANGAQAAVAGPTAAPSAGAATSVVQYDGALVQTRYGPVQVRITVSGGALVDVAAIALPSGGHSGQISSAVAPILRSQALSAAGGAIDGVSGATYTSEAYARSLQAALDQAGL